MHKTNQSDQPNAVTDSFTAKLIRFLLPVFVAGVVWAMYPYTAEPAGPIKSLLIHWGAVGFGAVALLGSWLEKRPFQRPPVFMPLMLALLVIYAVSALLSPYWGHSSQYVLRWAALFVLYLAAAYAYRQAGQVHRLIVCAAGAVGIASIYGLAQWWGYDFFPWGDDVMGAYQQLPASFGNPNYAAHALVLTLVFAAYLLTTKQRWFGAIVIVLCGGHLYLTEQRAGWVALAVALLVAALAWVAFRVARRPMVAAGVGLAAVALVAGGLAAGGVYWHEQQTGQAYPVDGSLLLRYNGYYSAADMIMDRPVLGFGPGNYEIANAEYWTGYEQRWFAQERMYNENVHNDYLEMGVEGGLPAAALYIAILVFGVGYALAYARGRSEPQARRLGIALAAFFAAFAVDSFFGFNLRVPVSGMFLFLFAGCLDGLLLEQQKPRASSWLGGGALLWRLAVLALAGAAAAFATWGFLGEQSLQTGRAAVAHEAYEDGIELFEEAESYRPWDWRPTRERGAAELRRQQAEAAIEALEEADRKNPNYPPTLLPLAHTAMVLGMQRPQPDEHPEAQLRRLEYLEDAERYAQRAVDLSEYLFEAHEILGRVLLVQGLHRSQASAEEEENGETPEELWYRSASHLRKALRYGAPNPVQLYQIKAETYVLLDEIPRAEIALSRGLNLDPGNEDLLRFFTGFAREHERHEAAIRIAESQLEADTTPETQARLHALIAEALAEGRGDREGARQHLIRALEAGPWESAVWNGVAKLARAYGDFEFIEEAQAIVERDAGEWPASFQDVFDGFGRALRAEDGHVADEIRQYMVSAHQHSLMGRGMNTELRAMTQTLLSGLERRHLTEEDVGNALVDLAIVFQETNDFGVAAQLLAQAEPLVPEERRQTLHLVRAENHLAMGEPGAAVPVLDRALEEDPDNVDYRVTRARMLSMAGRTEEARAEYERVLESGLLDESSRQLVEHELDRLSGESSENPFETP
ncbi:MAG: O-antigen ligase family protein [Candidatus Hydrogenedentota bacterium]